MPPPASGEAVLDVAAAPGGKGFSLFAFEPDVRLVSADLSLRRLLTLRDNERRIGTGGRLLVGRERPVAPVGDKVGGASLYLAPPSDGDG